MAKLKVLTATKQASGDVELPAQFTEAVRPDLITRAVLALQAAARQSYGGYGDAGMRHSAKLSRRRRKYRGSYGKGISRVPRKIHSARGSQMYMVGALAAGTVGGRRAHPPKPYKDWTQKVNKVENRKAIRSAMAASVQADLIAQRGHKVPKEFPFIIADDFEKITKTAELEKALVALGFAEELSRASVRKIRAGKGKARGRKYKTPTSFLFVVGKDDAPLFKAAGNIPGADITAVEGMNAELLAPGAMPGRLVLYTKSAIDRLAAEGLFLKAYTAKKEAPVEKKTPAKKPVKKVPAKKPAKK